MADNPRKCSHIRKACGHLNNIGVFTVDNDYSMTDDNAVDHIRGVLGFNSWVKDTESYLKFSQSSVRTDKKSWITMNALVSHNLH